ncbi:MAG: sigma-54-dependent Fis family transcriptional regulator [Deltaproteobacteria bacterium]|nr:sigma-54-dependent Fis family transcriptional regulator [Deltaproteobacteria bacterium]MCW5807371.1 sigma-54-dependent Fis family transcriptional regulator [Deltaproteobacteria bacterium]
MKTRVIIVDDDQGMRDMLAARLTHRGFAVTTCASGGEALDALDRVDADIVVSDVTMRGMTGVELCRRLLEHRPNLPVVLITAFGTMELAIQAIRAGAYDFLPKPFEIDQLAIAIERGVALAQLKDEVQRLRRAVAPPGFGTLIGESPRMTELYQVLGKIAQSQAAVMITGESGTGKELVARAIHDAGERAGGPFVAVNCAAMPAQLLESELFGHEKGAFTDARSAKAGLFTTANGGTIFLDEVGELPLEMQPKLLRALQQHAVRPVGSNAEVPFDARVITATNRDLETMVEERRFREDLYFRINVLQVDLPPLRSRGGDVLVLARHFLDKIAARTQKRIVGFSPEAAQKLVAYAWPGNVRELENCIERAVALASYDHIAVGDLPEKVRAFRSSQMVVGDDDPATLVTLEELERRYVARVLESVANNKAAAARILGIERKTLYRMLERWGERPAPEP